MPTSSDQSVTLRCQFCGLLNRIEAFGNGKEIHCDRCVRPILLDRPIKVSQEDFDEGVLEASVPVLVDFYADWCVECKYMERDTFADRDVEAALSAVVLVMPAIIVIYLLFNFNELPEIYSNTKSCLLNSSDEITVISIAMLVGYMIRHSNTINDLPCFRRRSDLYLISYRPI